MASPSLSATLTFVKKYPITLCGFSLFFMPSVHRLLLYFTPLLLSTAIFIVAMMTWGPRVSSEKSTTSSRRGGRRKLMAEHHEWAFHGTIEMDDDDDDDDEEEDEEDKDEGDHTQEVNTTKVSLTGKPSHTQVTTQKEETEPHSGLERREELEPDPDLAAEYSVRAVASGANFCAQVEPDPDSQGEAGVGTAAKDFHEDAVHGSLVYVGHASHEGYIHHGDVPDEGHVGPHVNPHETSRGAHDKMGPHEMSSDVHDKMGHAHDSDAHIHTSQDMVDTDAHQHQHANAHMQDEVHMQGDQSSYVVERLVQVSA